MSFFIRNGNTKRKRNEKINSKSWKATSRPNGSITNKEKKMEFNEDIESESDKEDRDNFYSDDEDAHLTVQEKKLKLAKKYLKGIEEEEREKLLFNDEQVVEENVLKRLKEDELEKMGKLRKKVADSVVPNLHGTVVLKCKQHNLSITCVIVSFDNQYLYSSSKEASIVKWSLIENVKVKCIFLKSRKKAKLNSYHEHYHLSTINCLAISADNKFLVSGDEKGIINIWNPENLNFIHTFRGHKNSITGAVICNQTNNLYTTSYDSLVKVWMLNELAYIETLYGHQKSVSSVDILQKDRVITSGGSDNTVRIWKVAEESQLVFHGQNGSIDMVKRIDNTHFVSCGDDGIISVWSMLKKKPLFNVVNAHGISESNNQPNWISCVCTLPNSDLIATGSCDGFVRLWKCAENYRSLTPVGVIPVTGFVNCIMFTTDGKYIIIAVGKEHRLGRWYCIKEAKNVIISIPLLPKE